MAYELRIKFIWLEIKIKNLNKKLLNTAGVTGKGICVPLGNWTNNKICPGAVLDKFGWICWWVTLGIFNGGVGFKGLWLWWWTWDFLSVFGCDTCVVGKFSESKVNHINKYN